MGTYVNLPGTFEKLQDGNLTIAPTNNSPIVMVLGTAGQGQSDTLYTVGRLSDASSAYGLDGTLIRGLFEASVAGGVNFRLYRIGATAATLVTNFGLTIQTVEEDSSAGGDYLVLWTDASLRLQVYRTADGTLVYDNAGSGADPSLRIDLGEVAVTGTAKSIGRNVGANPQIATSGFVALSGFVAATTSGTFTAGGDGLSMSRMQTYEALDKAYSLLQDQQMDVVVPMNVYLDDLNVTDMTAATISGLSLTSLAAYPVAGAPNDVLGKVYSEEILGVTYYWWWFQADATITPAGTISAQIFPSGVAGCSASASPTVEALTASNFHEVNFAYQLANFCYNQSQVSEDMTGNIGVLPPASFALKDVSNWVGTLPTVSTASVANGIITKNGTGLLGNKFMSGRLTLNGLPGHIVKGLDGYFNGGFIATDSGFLDGSQQVDNNGHLIDIGKYINVVDAYPILANGSRTTSYTATGASTYGGFYSTLDVANAPTNKQLNNLRLPFRVNTAKLDLLAGQRYVSFHQKTQGIVVSDAPTAARKDSDYNRLSTVRQVKAAVDAVRAAAEPFLGQGMTAAQQAAFDTAIDKALGALVKGGVIVRYEFNTIMTPQMKILGQATVELKLIPAFELRQITVVVALAAV